MGNRTGGALRVVVGPEDAFNSGQTTPTGYSIPKASCTFGWTEEMAASDELKDDPNPSAPIRGLWTTTGDLVQAVETDALGRMAKYFLTSYTNTGTQAPYTHQFKIGTATPSSLWIEVGDTTEGKYDQFKGVFLSALKVTATKRAEVLKATWTLLGSGIKTLNSGTAYDTSPDSYTQLRHYLVDSVLKVNQTASAVVTDVDFTVTRTIEMPKVLDGNRYAASFAAGAYEVKGTITGLWDSADTLRGYVTGDTTVDLMLECPRPGAPTKLVKFWFPEAKVGLTAAPSITTRGLVSVACDFYGYYLSDSEAAAFEIVCLNDLSTTY